MKEWIEKLKTDRTIKMVDGSRVDKYMENTVLHKWIDKLILEIEELERGEDCG